MDNGVKILPMEVVDVVDGYYLLKTRDRQQECKIKVGTVDMIDGELVGISDKTYIQLIIGEDWEEEDAMIAEARDVYPEPKTSNTIVGELNKDLNRHAWTYNETQCLIQSMATHLDDLNHAKKRKYVFANISNDLLSNGFSIDAAFCQSKWKNLLRSYKTCKDNQTKTGRGPTRFNFFEQMDELLGEKPSNKCNHTLESSNFETLVESNGLPHDADLQEEDEASEMTPTKEKSRKRKRVMQMAKDEFCALKKEEYAKRQKRHEENQALQEQGLK